MYVTMRVLITGALLLLAGVFAPASAEGQCERGCDASYDACVASGNRRAQGVREVRDGYERSCSTNQAMCYASCAEERGVCSDRPSLMHSSAFAIYGYANLLQGKPASEEVVRDILTEALVGNGGMNEFDFEKYLQGRIPVTLGWLKNAKRCLTSGARIGGFDAVAMPAYQFKEGYFDFGFLRKTGIGGWQNCYSRKRYKLALRGSDEAFRLRLPLKEAELLSRSNAPEYDFDYPGFSGYVHQVPPEGEVVVGVFGTFAASVEVRKVAAADKEAVRCNLPVSPLLPSGAFQKSVDSTIVTLTLNVEELRAESRSLGSKHTFVEGQSAASK